MFGSEILDVLIGLAVVFLFLSLLASAVREAIEAFWKSRAVFLERGIRELLNDRKGNGLTRELFRHPLIYSLFSGNYVEKETRRRGRGLPTYIPSRNFAIALMELVVRPEGTTPYSVMRTTSSYTIDELRASVARLASPFVQRAMMSAIDGAQGNVERVQENLQEWFDSAMDRVSGWYKRRTHLHLFVIGLVLTASLNVDTLSMANHLWHNKAARDALVKRAELMLADSNYVRAVRDTAQSDTALKRIETVRRRYEDVTRLDLPITWGRVELPTAKDRWFLWWSRTIFGFFLTAVAITLGAPFWFDLLNKMMVIRSTVKPKEKSQEEGSEDRPSDGKGKSAPRQPAQQPAASTPTAPVTQPAAPAGSTGAAATNPWAEPPTAAIAFEPRKWASANADEGLL
jgi:hypothetical protein